MKFVHIVDFLIFNFDVFTILTILTIILLFHEQLTAILKLVSTSLVSRSFMLSSSGSVAACLLWSGPLLMVFWVSEWAFVVSFLCQDIVSCSWMGAIYSEVFIAPLRTMVFFVCIPLTVDVPSLYREGFAKFLVPEWQKPLQKLKLKKCYRAYLCHTCWFTHPSQCPKVLWCN